MSLRQVRKLKQAAVTVNDDLSGVEDDSPVQVRRRNLFVNLRDSSSEAESETQEVMQQPKVAPIAQKRAKPKRHAPAKTVVEAEDSFDFDTLQPVADEDVAPKEEVPVSVLSRDKSALNPESEAKRLFGSAKQQKRAMIRGRKFWLGIPLEAENWPFVRDNLKLEKIDDGEFELISSQEYEKQLSIFVEVLQSQDMQILMEFVQRNPFHVHALLQLAEVFRQHSQFEQSFTMVRRALFSLECGFHFAFDPKIAPKLGGSSIFNSCLLKALALYTHLLIGQGCVRTALEVALFSLALDRDRDRLHSLVRIDFLCLRAKRYDIIEQLDLEISSKRLRMIFPNFAFSLALGKFQQLETTRGLEEEANSVSVSEIKSKKFEECSCSAQLVRAILLFPVALRALAAKLVENSRFDWTPLFVNLTEPAGRHPAIAKIAEAYAEHTFVSWKSEVVQSWLFACGRRAASLAPELTAWKKKVAVNSNLLDNYKDVIAAEFKTTEWVMPRQILDHDEEVIRTFGSNLRNRPTFSEMPANVSLDSNALMVFLQSLMPWARVDFSGTQAETVTIGGVFSGISERLGLAAPVIADASGGEECSSSSSEEEEVVLD